MAHPDSPDIPFYSRVLESLTLPLSLAAMVLNGALLYAAWGQGPTPWLVLAAMGVGLVLNFALIPPLAARWGATLGEWTRWVVNIGTVMFQGHLLHWPLPSWAFLPLLAFALDGINDPTWLWRLLAGVAAFDLAACLDGSSPLNALTFSALALASAIVSQRRATALRGTYQALQHSHDDLQAAHVVLTDVHQRALAQEKLAGLGLLAAGIAHEINNPMTYVTYNLEVFRDQLRELPHSPELLEEFASDLLPATINGVQRINAIVGDLRRFSRGDTEVAAPVDVNAEVEAALRIAHSQLRQRCKLEVTLGQLAPVRGYARQLSQVFVNLLVNASQAIPEDRTGVVGVSTALEKGEVVVRVRDNGMGMSEDTQKRLFTPFFTTKSVGVGTGLGLSIVQGIIRSHGGRIEIESQVGKGTTFSVLLPATAV